MDALLKSNVKITSMMKLVGIFLVLASLAAIAGLPALYYASAISTSTESEQEMNQEMAADNLKDEQISE